MNSVEAHVHLPAPASPSPSPVTLSARKGASVIMGLSSMVTSVSLQHPADAFMMDVIGKLVNSSGMEKNVRAFAPVMV